MVYSNLTKTENIFSIKLVEITNKAKENCQINAKYFQIHWKNLSKNLSVTVLIFAVI